MPLWCLGWRWRLTLEVAHLNGAVWPGERQLQQTLPEQILHLRWWRDRLGNPVRSVPSSAVCQQRSFYMWVVFVHARTFPHIQINRQNLLESCIIQGFFFRENPCRLFRLRKQDGKSIPLQAGLGFQFSSISKRRSDECYSISFIFVPKNP